MSFCPSCGKELSAEESNAKFCAYCGKPLAAEEPVVEEAPVVEETPVTEEAPATEEAPTTEEAPKAEAKQGIDVEAIKAKLIELKDKALELCDKVIEKAKTVPAIAGILEKIDSKFYPAVVAAPIVVVLLVLILVIGAFSSGSYMSPLNDFLNQANKKTADEQKLTSTLMSDSRYNLMKKVIAIMEKSDSYADSIEKTNDRLEEDFEKLDDEFDKWKIKFETKSKEKLDKDDVEDLQESLEDYYDDYAEKMIDQFDDILEDDDKLEDYADMMDLKEKEVEQLLKAYIKYYESFENVKVSEAYEVKGKFIVTADKDEFKTETVKLFFAKINGNWVYAGCDGSLELEDSEGYFDFIMEYLEDDYTRR